MNTLGIERLLRAIEELLASHSSVDRVLLYRRYPELLTSEVFVGLDLLLDSAGTNPTDTEMAELWSALKAGFHRLHEAIAAEPDLTEADQQAEMPQLIALLQAAIVTAAQAKVSTSPPRRTAQNQADSWAVLARQLLALDNWTLIPTIVAAAKAIGDRELIQALQAFATRDAHQLQPLAVPLEKRLRDEGKEEEAWTMALLALHLRAGWILAAAKCPPNQRNGLVNAALGACEQAGEIAEILDDELCMGRYFAWLGLGLEFLDRLEDAEKAHWVCLQLWEPQTSQYPTLREEIGVVYSHLGELYSVSERFDAAEEAFRKAAEWYEELGKEDPERYGPMFAATQECLGSALVDLWRWEEARKTLRAAVPPLREAARREPEEWDQALGSALGNLGIALRKLNRPMEAAAVIRDAIEITGRLAEKDPDEFCPVLRDLYSDLGNVLQDLDQPSLAEAAQREALRLDRQR